MANRYCDYSIVAGDTSGDGSIGNPYRTIQKCISVMTGADTCWVANTIPQILSVRLDFNFSGYVNNGKSPIFRGWDRGGSQFSLRPNEVIPRPMGYIDINNQINLANYDQKFTLIDLRFYNPSAAGRIVFLPQFSRMDGCEIGALTGDRGGIYVNGPYVNINNLYVDSTYNSTQPVIDVGQPNSRITNSYFNNPRPGASNATVYVRSNASSTTIANNIFSLNQNEGAVRFENNQGCVVEGNSLQSDNLASQYGVFCNHTSLHPVDFTNNVFYNFNNTSQNPIKLRANTIMGTNGYNAYYDCNANDVPADMLLNLTAYDITGVGNPFVDSINSDYKVTGSAAQGVARSNATAVLDMGAVQGPSGGSGSANNIFILNA